MARAGILYSDVAKAAIKLIEDGKNPTVDSVRDTLGSTGSKSTIAPFLKRWKAEHQGEMAQVEVGLPASLLQAVKGLYQHMQAEFAQQLERAKQQHAEELRAAVEREQQWRSECDAVVARNTALNEDLVRARDALTQLQERHHAQSVTLAAVQAENAGLQQRLADRAAELTTLDCQLTQARAQFEHYQEAMATQRAEERQAYEQRIVRLEQELGRANRDLTTQQSTLGQQEARIAHLMTEQTSLQQALLTAQEELATERSTRERLSERLEEAVATKKEFATQLACAQEQLTETRMVQATKEREVSLLEERVRRDEERAERLAEEKIDLLQIRARLEQQIHHLITQSSTREPSAD